VVAPDYNYGRDYNYMPYATSDTYASDVPANAAQLVVRVPNPDAKVWFQGQLTSQRGSVREFESPPLEPGKDYTYDVRTEWNQDGRKVVQTRQVEVRAGSVVNVDLTRPQARAEVPASTGQ
jgi:uncharacterized protein (TIGR03000 family)